MIKQALSGKSFLCLSLMLLITVFFSSEVTASPSYFYNDIITDRASFQAASGPLYSESFEDSFSDTYSLSFSAENPDAFVITSDIIMDHNDFSRIVTDGIYAVSFEEYPTSTITFSFDNPINAFGIDVNDMNFGTMTYSDNLGNSFTDVLQGSTMEGTMLNPQFFGVVNTDAFTSVTLTFTNTDASLSGTLALDRLEYGMASVPLPASLLFLLSGIIGLAGFRKKLK